MFRANPQHFSVALRAMFFLARHTAIVRHNGVAFWADALPTASHSVLAILFGHFGSPELSVRNEAPVDQPSPACI